MTFIQINLHHSKAVDGSNCQKLDLGVVDKELSRNHGFMMTTNRKKLALEKQYFLLHLPNG
jgi:hypothetical protein